MASEPKFLKEPYLSDIQDLRQKMTFKMFENGKPYSFDYHFKEKFDNIYKKIEQSLLNESYSGLSPAITNNTPIFMSQNTARIAFFSYRAKSARDVEIADLEKLLTKQAIKQVKTNLIPNNEISNLVQKDLKIFHEYHTQNSFTKYKRDIFTLSIQFNAYDKNDNLLIEKSFVRGGLVFDMTEETFQNNISISYARYRKQRSDKKNDYLPLKLIKMRGIEQSD